MSKFSYCGIDCEVCPAYTATQNNSTEERTKVAEDWSKAFNCDMKADDINCDGCTAHTGKVIWHWNECEIRQCAEEMKVPTCASCNDYACETLNKFLDQAPEMKKNLESLRNK
jgi:hypothetical protein